MARYTVDSTWAAIGAPGEALTIRNTSAEAMQLVFTAIAPPASLGDTVDVWSLHPNEGVSLRARYDGLTLWARTLSGASAMLEAFKHLAIVAGEGFYELDPVNDGVRVELLSGGTFDQTTGAHWTQNPANTATVTHGTSGLTMTPASTAFDDRAQVFQNFSTTVGSSYTVTVTADQVPSPDSCVCLIYDADGGVTLIESQAITTAGDVTFDFVATSSVSGIYLRVYNTTSPTPAPMTRSVPQRRFSRLASLRNRVVAPASATGLFRAKVAGFSCCRQPAGHRQAR